MSQTHYNQDAYWADAAEVAAVIGRKWTVPTMYALIVNDGMRFTDVCNELDVSSKVMSDTLNIMMEHGMVSKVESNDSSSRGDYMISSKAEDLFSAIKIMEQYGREN